MTTSRTTQARNEMKEINEMFKMGLITPREKFELNNEVYMATQQYNRLSN